jgi:RimJ/RimL family protein N-acetyltransferase
VSRRPTARADLWLRELRPVDAAGYHALVQDNAGHLTRLGDYRDEVAAGADDFAAQFSESAGVPLRFAIEFDGRLVGRVDLLAVDPPRYGLGYWLAEDATGKGLATTAVAAVLDHARGLGATDVFAGVTYGNVRSEALLRRLAFAVVADLGTYRRFHLVL